MVDMVDTVLQLLRQSMADIHMDWVRLSYFLNQKFENRIHLLSKLFFKKQTMQRGFRLAFLIPFQRIYPLDFYTFWNESSSSVQNKLWQFWGVKENKWKLSQCGTFILKVECKIVWIGQTNENSYEKRLTTKNGHFRLWRVKGCLSISQRCSGLWRLWKLWCLWRLWSI